MENINDQITQIQRAIAEMAIEINIVHDNQKIGHNNQKNITQAAGFVLKELLRLQRANTKLLEKLCTEHAEMYDQFRKKKEAQSQACHTLIAEGDGHVDKAVNYLIPLSGGFDFIRSGK